MIVLGLDTALRACSAAILAHGKLAARRIAPMEKGHAEHLAPLVAATFEDAGLTPGDLDRVGVVVGPGGFAGVRVGVAFARGLTLGTGVAAVAVNSLEALAAGGRRRDDQSRLFVPVIDARRGDVYAALYESDGAARLQPFVAPPKEALARLADAAGGRSAALIGNGAPLLVDPPGDWRRETAVADIDPDDVAHLAAGATPDGAPPRPFYLRPPDAKPPTQSIFAGLTAE
ncbi:MAG: tRNA (adenosine(37)-N6)-threonylcarbamoyltransferase complex dimerization subunit type 1 TsaB [Pseudomonadota bacterium]